MEIINLDKITGYQYVVLVGRAEHVRAVARHMLARLVYAPGDDDYFMDFPAVVKELGTYVSRISGPAIITTQSSEFLDCLLVSDIPFIMATVRKYDHDGDGVYRLRVLSKDEAWADRRDFNMELRI